MKYLKILLLILLPLSLSAQQKEGDALKELYLEQLHPSDPLLNGREYKYYFQPQVSTPLIPQDQVPTASVSIRGKKLQNVMLLYDTFKDLLVYYNPNTQYSNTIIVNSHMLEEFFLKLPDGEARFKYLEFAENQGGLLSSGFYEIVSQGASTFIIDHRSHKKLTGGVVAYSYTKEKYIIRSGRIYKIKGKKSLLEALSDRPLEMNEYLKQNNIRVKQIKKNQLKDLIEHYESLKHTGN